MVTTVEWITVKKLRVPFKDEFVLKMSEAFTDFGSVAPTKKKALDAIYAWANADALTQTKPKNGRLLESRMDAKWRSPYDAYCLCIT